MSRNQAALSLSRPTARGGKTTNPSDFNQRAFTLIELLAVVSIVGVLAALILPATQKAITQARETQSLANLHGLGHLCLIFAGDNNGYLLNANDPSNNSDWFAQLKNAGLIDPTRDRKLLVCPLMNSYSGKLAGNVNKVTSYAMNAYLGPRADGAAKGTKDGINTLQAAAKPSATALLLNSIYYPGTNGSWRTAATASASLNEIDPADGKHVNVLFLDGSVAFLDSKDARLTKAGPAGTPEYLFWTGKVE